ncbi:Superfamily I DNA and RNA helicases [Rosenbergiella nectarea]|uniref:DNA 3'-5' helicase II n=1 Tax=Rosenbergiella nectarea TaxID=988801 RepID=A0A1H9D7E2_9GAMM|nr:ATP-binding domain-containing protein [Rosenbergiella nectarea]SEQ09412.1 Superfamily I DNA and RNA helicases [Rosenbergiella nectarea]
MIEILGMKPRNHYLGNMIEEEISKIEGTKGYYYRGFPVISLSDSGISLDGILCSEKHGLIIFHFTEESEITDDYIESIDEIHMKFISKISEVKSLTKNRMLNLPLNSIVFCPNSSNHENIDFDEGLFLSDRAEVISEFMSSINWGDGGLLETLLSNIQSLSKLKSKKKRFYVKKNDSKGSVLKRLDSSLATLDSSQTTAVLVNIDGVQRIRGLAGSGKTIVLARKIAHIHSQNPDWKIAVTFNSRSLKEQLKFLITAFSGEDGVDWDNVEIIHAWGGTKIHGMYYKACLLHNVPFYDFGESKSLMEEGDTPFQAVCRNFLEAKKEDIPLYDFILVDEAQDFSVEFLRICYSLLKDEKRLVYAYDELQNLGDQSMPSPEQIWGKKEDGTPVVSFTSEEQDITLDICYRNPGPILTTAHALGFGIYHTPMIQMFDFEGLWTEIGYQKIDGELVEGKDVILSRTQESSPSLLSSHNSIDEMINFNKFVNKIDQSNWIAQQIIKNIKEEELLPSDIVVIHPDTMRMRKEVGYLRDLLFNNGINNSIAGITSSPDEFFSDNSVTFTSIFRAKGNEAAMVYIMDADYCNVDYELSKRRNILFTAMTRTKAWLRVCGIGQFFDGLVTEFETVRNKNFSLDFRYPTAEERDKMKVVNRDMTVHERKRVSAAKLNAQNLSNLLDGQVKIEDIPEDLRNALIRKLTGG